METDKAALKSGPRELGTACFEGWVGRQTPQVKVGLWKAASTTQGRNCSTLGQAGYGDRCTQGVVTGAKNGDKGYLNTIGDCSGRFYRNLFCSGS